MIFPNKTRKIKFQRDFFGKTIFSGRLEKENMVFRAVYVPCMYICIHCHHHHHPDSVFYGPGKPNWFLPLHQTESTPTVTLLAS